VPLPACLLEFLTMTAVTNTFLVRAKNLHRHVIVIDTHCDTTQRLLRADWDFSARHDDGHVDIPRLREGGIGGVFLAVYASGPVEAGAGIAAARTQIERIYQTVRMHDESLTLARTADDVRRAKAGGKIAVLL
jgi:membrane dipeptidase